MKFARLGFFMCSVDAACNYGDSHFHDVVLEMVHRSSLFHQGTRVFLYEQEHTTRFHPRTSAAGLSVVALLIAQQDTKALFVTSAVCRGICTAVRMMDTDATIDIKEDHSKDATRTAQ